MRSMGRSAIGTIARVFTLTLLVVACSGQGETSERSTPATTPVAPSAGSTASASEPRTGRIVAEPIAVGLDHPATFVFADDGALYYGERLTGEIRRIDPVSGDDSSVYTIPDVVGELSNEQGLVGVSLPPSFPERPWLYAYATRLVDGVARDQVLRIAMDGNHGTSMRLILDVQAAGERHNGGRLLFGPDGMLYVVVGETYDPTLAQDLSVNGGKVLRMTPNGTVPDDNPVAGSLVFSYGNRNSFGLAFDPLSGDLWETENGPECNDELNRIVPGRNHGWGPSATCSGDAPRNTNQDGPRPVLPERFYPTTIAPTGIAFCDGCGLGSTREGHLFFGAFNTGDIHEVTLSADRSKVARDTTPFNHGNLVLSLESAPDGTLYFSDGIGIYRLELRM